MTRHANVATDYESLKVWQHLQESRTANIMPGEQRQLIIHRQIAADVVEAAVAAHVQQWPGAPGLIVPVLTGIAFYRTQFDTTIRHTGFVYEIGFWDPQKGITVTAMDPASDGDIQQDRVRIRRHLTVDGDFS